MGKINTFQHTHPQTTKPSMEFWAHDAQNHRPGKSNRSNRSTKYESYKYINGMKEMEMYTPKGNGTWCGVMGLESQCLGPWNYGPEAVTEVTE